MVEVTYTGLLIVAIAVVACLAFYAAYKLIKGRD